MHGKIGIIAGIAILILLSGCAQQDNVFTIGFIPSEMSKEVTPKAEAIGNFLEERTGMEVEVVVPTSYEPLLEGIRFGHLDAIYTDGGAGWIAHKRTGAEVVLAEKRSDGRAYYNAAVFARSDSPITSIDDPQAKNIAFTSWTGSSGFVMPVGTLIQRNRVNPQGDDFASLEAAIGEAFDNYAVSGGYKQSLTMLINGQADVVGGADDAPEKYLEKEEQQKIKQVEILGRVPSHPILVRQNLKEEIKNKFVSAMLELNKSENVHLLKDIYGVDGLVETNTQEHLGDFGPRVDALVGIQERLLE